MAFTEKRGAGGCVVCVAASRMGEAEKDSARNQPTA